MTASGTTPGNPRWRARFAVYAALLFAGWHLNALGLPESTFAWTRSAARTSDLGFDSSLVVSRLARNDLPALHPLVIQTAWLSFEPYRSQFGLTGVVLAPLRDATGAHPAAFSAVFALLTAAVVAGVFAAAHRWLGPPTGDVACGLAAFAPGLLRFAPSLYWVPFLMLLPFALVWWLYPRGRKFALLTAVGAAVMLKALCGYEFITAVILAPVAAAWFHQHRMCEPLRRRAAFAAGIITAGLIGFAAAMALHVWQMEVVLGQDGIEAIRERAARRTAGAVEPHETRPGVPAAPTDFALVVRSWREYLGQRALSSPALLPAVRKDVPLSAVLLAVGAFAVAAAVGRGLPRDAGALAGAAVLALAAAASWFVLAVNHVCTHLHLNGLAFAVPFLPVAFVTAGYVVRLTTGRFAAWLGRVALAAVAGLMIVSSMMTVRDRVAADAEQERAEAAVLMRLAAGSDFDGPPVGCADECEAVRTMPHAVLLEAGLLDPATDTPIDPDGAVVRGWAVGRWHPARRPTARLVVVAGGSVVRCPVARFRRPDLEALAGRPLPGAGFTVMLPAPQGERVRLFAVSTADPPCVTELPIPAAR